MVSVDVKHHVYLVPYYSEYTTTQQVMRTVYYSETLHMEDCCLYTMLHHAIVSIQTPNMSHTPLRNDRSSSSGGSSIKGEGVCVGVGGEILLINIVTLSPPINSNYWNPALQQFPTTKASKSTITMLHPLDRSNPNPFFCAADPL